MTNNRLAFADEDKDGFWVINLPKFVKIITLGHVYLKSGEKL